MPTSPDENPEQHHAHDTPAHDTPAHDIPAHDIPAHDIPAEDFLVCGLGRLGRECVAVLKAFGVHVIGVDISAEAGKDPALSNLLDAFHVGDCSHADILK